MTRRAVGRRLRDVISLPRENSVSVTNYVIDILLIVVIFRALPAGPYADRPSR